MTTLREDLEALAEICEHNGRTLSDPAASRDLMHATALRQLLTKHFPTGDVDLARHATTEPGLPPGETDDEPPILPEMRYPRPLPDFPQEEE